MSKIDRKIGRNENCPCNSGKKYKHCCGKYTAVSINAGHELPFEERMRLDNSLASHQAKEARRRQQQGLGRPIISAEFSDHRIVAVGNTVHWSKTWKTFHDFLFDYIKDIFGREWGAAEQAKPLGKRHILLRWAYEIGEYHKAQVALAPSKKIISSPSTPILTAYLGLAYNLYLMKHNAKLQSALIARLKKSDESLFHGAYYETFVAAAFIKAGYDIAFENEQDGSATHCEFVASSRSTPRKFSVEAKARFRTGVTSDVDVSTLRLGIKDKLGAALQKQACHTRVVFIDVNVPENHPANEMPFWVEPAVKEMRDLENTMISSGQETPSAYVVATNHPYQFDIPGGLSAVMEGFNISEYKLGAQFSSLRAAFDARSRHEDIHHVFESMQKYHAIPSTFEGEMPEIHFHETQDIAPLKIGGRYLVPDQTGTDVPGELESASVLENEKNAYGVYRLDDGRRIIVVTPLTDHELAAYRRYPETFFGEIDNNVSRKCNDIFDWYDFLFESYSKTSKEKLLEFMKDAIDFEMLKLMPQDELAKTYCERLAYSLECQRSGNASKPQPT
jgi:hypothetical protein